MYSQGLLLTIRKPEQDDMAAMTNWLSDPLFLKNVYGSPIESYQVRYQKVHQFLNQNAKDFSQNLTLIAVDTLKQRPIGLLMFNHINWKHRNAEMNAAIGEPSYRSAIYGVDLYILGLLVGFCELNLHKVFGYTYASNDAALKLNNFGGKVNGILKNHVFKEGKFVDVVTHSILKDQFHEFIQNQKDKILKKHAKKGIFDGLLE